jgi:hypothetical protein
LGQFIVGVSGCESELSYGADGGLDDAQLEGEDADGGASPSEPAASSLVAWVDDAMDLSVDAAQVRVLVSAKDPAEIDASVRADVAAIVQNLSAARGEEAGGLVRIEFVGKLKVVDAVDSAGTRTYDNLPEHASEEKLEESRFAFNLASAKTGNHFVVRLPEETLSQNRISNSVLLPDNQIALAETGSTFGLFEDAKHARAPGCPGAGCIIMSKIYGDGAITAAHHKPFGRFSKTGAAGVLYGRKHFVTNARAVLVDSNNDGAWDVIGNNNFQGAYNNGNFTGSGFVNWVSWELACTPSNCHRTRDIAWGTLNSYVGDTTGFLGFSALPDNSTVAINRAGVRQSWGKFTASTPPADCKQLDPESLEGGGKSRHAWTLCFAGNVPDPNTDLPGTGAYWVSNGQYFLMAVSPTFGYQGITKITDSRFTNMKWARDNLL